MSIPSITGNVLGVARRLIAEPAARAPRSRGLSPSVLVCARSGALAAVLALAAAAPFARAQDAYARETRSCIEVAVEGQRSVSFDCLNQGLREAALNAPPPTHVFDVYDAVGSGAPNQAGTFSFTATSIRMGDAFGRSAFPQQRPLAPVWSNAFVGGR